MTPQRPNKTVIVFICIFALFIGAAQTLHARASIDYPIVKLRSLDKITARTEVFEANVGRTIKFGSVYIKVQACRKAPELEQPEAAAFLQVWEVPPAKRGDTEEPKAEWIFSGWMFASSPGLSAMDHPIYDVWVLDCLQTEAERAVQEQEAKEGTREGEGVLDEDETPIQPSNEPVITDQ